MADIYTESNFYMSTSSACIVNLVPPVFSGINFLDVESRGQIRAGWSSATDTNNPIRYEVYIKASNAAGLFNAANITGITDKTQLDIFTMPDGSFLQNGTTYYVGVRAVDAIGNRDSNLVSLNVISTGVLTSIDMYESKAAWSFDANDEFRVTAWCDKNDSLAVAPTSVMGGASYQVYNNLGFPVGGLAGAVGSPNAQGLYVFPAVVGTLDLINNHYQIRVSVNVDGEDRVNFVDIPASPKEYVIDAVADFNDQGQVVGSFWVTRNGDIATQGLGLGSFEVYNASGVLLPLSESGLSADANGFFTITPITPAAPLDVTQSYIIKCTVEVDGQMQNNYITVGNDPEVYDYKAIFSINALNQLEATFWATKNNEVVTGVSLGTASYQIYDKSGNTVAGLSETGLVADGNGYFHISPVSALLLSDLTHYTAKISINVANVPRTSSKGFTLLGT